MGGASTPSNSHRSKSGKRSDKVFQHEEDKAQKRISEYQRRNVFISFDVDDKGQVTLLRSQATDDRFPVTFRDYSVKEPFDSAWRSKVRDRIAQCSAVFVAIGENTHESEPVDWEIREAHRQGKKVVGVRLYSDKNHTVPQAIKDHDDKVINWDTKKMQDELE